MIPRISGKLGIVALLSVMAGCVSGGPPPEAGGPVRVARGSPLDGEWVSTDGVAASRFSGGVFTTTALDTGNKLADGSYRMSGSTVDITVKSLIRNTTTSVACAMVAPSQLNCTSSTGQQFILTRRGVA
jgi:hypothetical protein